MSAPRHLRAVRPGDHRLRLSLLGPLRFFEPGEAWVQVVGEGASVTFGAHGASCEPCDTEGRTSPCAHERRALAWVLWDVGLPDDLARGSRGEGMRPVVREGLLALEDEWNGGDAA